MACGLMLLTTSAHAQNWDFSASVGTDGIGLDLSKRCNAWIGVRTGASFIPRFDYNMHFGVELNEENATAEESASRFQYMSSKLQDLTGLEMKDEVRMVGRPKFVNYKLLVDVYPFRRDRRWSVTAGFYVGSKTIARAENALSEASTLLGVSLYNRMYEKAVADEPVLTVGSTPVYMPQLADYGRMGMNVGTYADGTAYIMEPDEDNTVSARVRVNRFRPYLGVGFGDALDRAGRLSYRLECGALFWGGTPSVVTHDGTDLTQLAHVNGRPGDYVDLIKRFRVYPVVALRLSYTLF
jgi:hypothetical protein